MHRRHFILTALAAIVVGPAVARAQVPPMEEAPAGFAAIRFTAAGDDGIRSLTARVSRWNDASLATGHAQYLVASAGSALPLGEFYQSDPVDLHVPEEALPPPADARGWHTTVGVAAWVTEWVLLVVQRDTLVWDLRLSGAEGIPLLDEAVALAAGLVTREATGDLFALLPDADEVPAGLVVEWRMTPDGTTDAAGTPIAEPTPE